MGWEYGDTHLFEMEQMAVGEKHDPSLFLTAVSIQSGYPLSFRETERVA